MAVSLWPALGLTVLDELGSPVPTSGISVGSLTSYYLDLVVRGYLLTYDPLNAGSSPSTVTTQPTIFASTVVALAPTIGSAEGQIAVVSGHTASNDGGGGTFIWRAGDSTTANGGTVIGAGWHRVFSGPYNVKWFGAKGDGVTDDVLAIQAAINVAAAGTNGGQVFVPRGTYLLASRSGDAQSYASLVTPKNNVHILGEGMDVTTFKLGAGLKNLPSIGTGPMVFGKTGILRNAKFEEFTIDWNGPNNLLTSGDTARNFAGIFAIQGGIDVHVRRVRFKDNPGNQCVFFPATSDAGQKNIIVEHCRFENCGSALSGNYNLDHSSIYCNGKYLKFNHNTFYATTVMKGAAFEIHGSYGEAVGNLIQYHERPWWIANDYESATGISIRDNVIENCDAAWGWGDGPGHTHGTVEILNNKFSQRSGASGWTFFAEAPKQLVDRLVISGNVFTGIQENNGQFAIQYNLVKDMIFTGNIVQNFSLRGWSAGGTDIGGGYCGHVLRIEDNVWRDCVESAQVGSHAGVINMQPALQIRSLSILRNVFEQSTSLAVSPINLNLTVDAGMIADNMISPNMTANFVIASAAAGVLIDQTRNIAPGAHHAAIGSQWRDIANGILYLKVASGTAWKKVGHGTSAPSTGTWSVGDEQVNTSPASGAYIKWVCTVAGTPGTWKTAGVIS